MSVRPRQKVLSYVLITPARTDRQTGQTKSSVAISIPLRASPWIELVRRPEHSSHDFGAKALCFNAGYQRIKNLEYDVIGNLDADISFEPDYFEFLLGKFALSPDLGVAGTPMREKTHDAVQDGFFNQTDVFGAYQLFRREGFEQIGGYTPVKWGGIDWIALRSARMNGWMADPFLPGKAYLPPPSDGRDGQQCLAGSLHLRDEGLFSGKSPLVELIYRLFVEQSHGNPEGIRFWYFMMHRDLLVKGL